MGDHVFLKVMPKKGVVRFSKKEKISPRFIGTFEVLERVGEVAYKLALLPSLASVHEVFHVSMLRKYTPYLTRVVADALNRKSWGVLASVASQEWQMFEVIGQFDLQYCDQAQGVFRNLVATPSLLSRVIESQGQDVEVVSIKDKVQSGTRDEG